MCAPGVHAGSVAPDFAVKVICSVPSAMVLVLVTMTGILTFGSAVCNAPLIAIGVLVSPLIVVTLPLRRGELWKRRFLNAMLASLVETYGRCL